MSSKKNLWDDCERPACDEMVDMMKKASAAASSSTPKKKAAKADDVQCPPGSGALGKASWTLLHAMTAWYPEQPSDKDQQDMKSFFGAFARFYPCTWCAKDFQDNLERKPVQTKSRKELCQWLCEQHNLVNEKLGKPAYSCDMKDLDERWRKSTKPECEGKGH